MAKLTYRLAKFDAEKAQIGVLCVMVTNDTLAGGSISNLNLDGTDNSSFMGAGICKYIKSNLFELTIDSTIYQFDGDGRGLSPESIVGKYKILFGYLNTKLTLSGNAFISDSTTIVTRGDDGTTSTKIDYDKKSYNIIDSLNARDEFAVHALRELMCHIPDPSALSESDMNYYCDIAYKWAANMMQASSEARGSFVQETSSSGTSTSTSTSLTPISSNSLTSNSEKIINNILAVLERTDNVETVSEKSVYSKRVRLQFTELINFLNNYVKNGDSIQPLGLKDLINAISGIGTTLDFTELVNAIKGIKGDTADTSTVSIGDKGLGKDAEHPIYMSGGGFPTKKALAAGFTSDNIDSFLTFNSDGAVGYSALAEVKKAAAGWIANYDSLETLYNGSVKDKDNLLLGLKTYVIQSIDTRVKTWLNNTTIVSDGNGGFKLKVPDNILLLQSEG